MPSSNPSSTQSRPASMAADPNAPAELSAVVDELLDSLTQKFASVSGEIFGKLDEMTRRLDNLEAQVQAAKEGGMSSPKK